MTDRTFMPLQTIACLAGCLALAGCSKQEFKLAPVSGICTCKGEPMTAGLLIFNPMRNPEVDGKKMNLGKPAHAEIQPDGSFTMSTYGTNDGAVIGKHTVVLNLAELDDDDPKQPCSKVAEGVVVEVVAGENTLEIDLAGQ